MILTLGFSTAKLLGQTEKDPITHLSKIPIKPNHKKPVIVIIGENKYTELTDFIVPYGVIKRANISEVYALAPNKGIMEMFPTLSIEITTSIEDFDLLHPEGADLVIMPAIHNMDNKTLIQWIQKQYKLDATIAGICDGVWTLAHAGLLKNKKATGHWYSISDLTKSFPDTVWVKNKRYLQDKNIITTAGVTASLPFSLAIVESIAGKKKAREVAKDLGVQNWDSVHESERFHLDWKLYLTAAKNRIFIWSYETIGITIYDGIDEISLALMADAYSRTYKSTAVVMHSSQKTILTKSGIRFVSDTQEIHSNQVEILKEIPKNAIASQQLNETLREIESRYGTLTMQFVAMQLEFPMHE
ncbi:DJ-1/PfpI family protein [Leptospira sp. 201903074]|uniref:DJ-1/PfpI family protein n=1 Tax=Leptospira abararensis TaxID=2810036 RepID=UPI0019647F17|nr:DJ-1/PfpI family protein [Leptospira abararensis]MBM9548768.1 DJ-1/PfpI family protein [Leptospira abararensis]